MQKRTRGIGLAFIVLFVSATLVNAAGDAPREIAEKAASRLGRELSEALMTAMTNKGPSAAIDVCAKQAPAFVGQIEKDLGVTIKRTALKIRNPQNAPDTVECNLLQKLTAAKQAGETLPRGVTPFPGTQRRFYKIITAQPTCLPCHGDSAMMSERVRREIAVTYPDDQATGYVDGDLRGIISVLVK
jgi:hypothetical protein